MMVQKKYEERIVLFLDILGFSELVKNSTSNVDGFNKIKTAINIIRRTFKINQKSKERTITQFSDCIVVSFLITEKGEVAYLLAKTNELIKKLILKDILCRGGIAKGGLIHDDIFMFGPAFLEAYKLESKVAIYPRVVLIDKEIISIGINNYGYHPANDKKYEESEIYSNITRDFDGLYFVDYFLLGSVWELAREDKAYLNNLRKLIVSELSKIETDSALKEKYEWMKKKFNDLVVELKADNRVYLGFATLGSDKRSRFYRKLKLIE